MDHGRRFLIPAVPAGVLAGCAIFMPVDEDPAHLPQAVSWNSPRAAAVSILTEKPVTCQRSSNSPAEAARRRRGRLVFESPALLGGQAARSGMSCASCHRNGRGNPHFRFPGVSGAPGTADVTTGFFSEKRGDDRFNPVAIPDLAVRTGAKFPDRHDESFREFVRGLIIEEFQGAPPPPALFEDLLIYLDGLDLRACADPLATRPVTWQQDWQDAGALVAEAGKALADDDRRAARFLLRAARLRLETLHVRYSTPGARAVQTRLVKASRRLERAMKRLHDDPEVAAKIIRGWSTAERKLERALDRHAEHSLYNRDVLARTVAEQTSPQTAEARPGTTRSPI